MSAVPTPYDRVDRFGSASSNNPSNPIQGSDLDAEFDAVEISMDQTQARLAEIQRDDGGLKNGIVTHDSISTSFINEFVTDITEQVTVELQPVLDEAAASAAEAEAAKDAATEQADRAESEADRARDEADRAESEADRAKAEADRSAAEANNSQQSASESASSADLADSAAKRAEDALDNLLPFYVEHDGDGVTTTFALPTPVEDELYVDAYVNGAHVSPTLYIASGSSIVFTTPPSVGTKNVAIRIASGLTAAPVTSEDWGDLNGITGDSLDWGSL